MNKAEEILTTLIKEFEGCKLEAYLCPAGVATVGWGNTHGVKLGDVWTQEKADAELAKMVKSHLQDAIEASPILESQSPERCAAIADFIYNLGIGAYNKSTLKKRVDVGDWVAAQAEIIRWNKAGGKVLKGLVKRRAREAELLKK